MVERFSMAGGVVMHDDPYLPDEKCAACAKRGVAVTGDICGMCAMRLREDGLNLRALRWTVVTFLLCGFALSVWVYFQ